MGIDFRLSENQIALRDGARAFAKGVLKDVRTTIRKYAKPEDRFPFHKQGVDAGFVKGLFPKQNLVARQAQVFSIFAQSYFTLVRSACGRHHLQFRDHRSLERSARSSNSR